MASTLTVDNISYSPGGAIEVNYTWNGEPNHGRAFASADSIIDYLMTAENDEEIALRMMLGYWHRRNAALDDESKVNGKTTTVDLSSVQIVKVV